MSYNGAVYPRCLYAVFSLILSMTGKINFQTGIAILLPVEFQEFQAILNGNKRTPNRPLMYHKDC